MGQVSRGLGARAPRAWGPAHQGPGAFSPQKPPKPLKLRFFANLLVSLAKAWVSAETAASEVGTWRETKPGYPPYPPPPTPPAFWGCKGERKFSPSPPSATIQHAPQGRRIVLTIAKDFTVILISTSMSVICCQYHYYDCRYADYYHYHFLYCSYYFYWDYCLSPSL